MICALYLPFKCLYLAGVADVLLKNDFSDKEKAVFFTLIFPPAINRAFKVSMCQMAVKL